MEAQKERPIWICDCGGLRKRTEKTIVLYGKGFQDLTIWECMLCGKIEIIERR